ncbi:MAG: C40 family peptidase [Elusimicrobia bacterium]|nr:C40 family peptidase [Elusimicrobiota bacterium]
MRRLALALALLCWAGCSSAPRAAKSGRGGAVAEWARRSLGRPYHTGGRAPDSGFDCSGLAWWSHRQAGIEIPPTSATQFEAGRQIKRPMLLPGDLVFFTTERRGPSHVGVYIGSDRFIHAPKSGSAVSTASLREPYWLKRFLGARRYW